MDSLGQTTWFSAPDVISKNWQIPNAQKWQSKNHVYVSVRDTKFLTHAIGPYDRTRHFSAYAGNFPKWILWRSCLIYLKDVIVFSKLFKANIKDVDIEMFDLRKARVSLKLEKYYFMTDGVKYLGNIIKPGALSPCRRKLQFSTNYSTPRTYANCSFSSNCATCTNVLSLITNILRLRGQRLSGRDHHWIYQHWTSMISEPFINSSGPFHQNLCLLFHFLIHRT